MVSAICWRDAPAYRSQALYIATWRARVYVSYFIHPIAAGKADYTKGNRFYRLEDLGQMPKIRLFGNAMLSLITKISSGYWNVMDPTNGYVAIHAEVYRLLPQAKIARRYFFESDILFRLGTIRAVVRDVPMRAKYADETSSLRITDTLFDFGIKHLRSFGKRLFYSYFLRDFNCGSLAFLLGVISIVLGLSFGSYHWYLSSQTGIVATSGTVMLSATPLIAGLQLLLFWLTVDITNVPQQPLHPQLYLALQDIETDPPHLPGIQAIELQQNTCV